MSASDYLENKILDHIFGKTAYTAPTNLYIALCTAAPTDASTGSTLTECNYTSYARKQTSPSDWDTAASGAMDNVAALAFPTPTGGSDQIATHWALVDAATNGNVLFHGELTASLSITISPAITPNFPIGSLVITAA